MKKPLPTKVKKEERHICYYCQKEIYGEEPIQVNTKRGGHLYLRLACYKGENNRRDFGEMRKGMTKKEFRAWMVLHRSVRN